MVLCRLEEGEEGGIVAAVHVSVTGHSSDFTVLVATGGGGGCGWWGEDDVDDVGVVDDVILDATDFDLHG